MVKITESKKKEVTSKAKKVKVDTKLEKAKMEVKAKKPSLPKEAAKKLSREAEVPQPATPTKDLKKAVSEPKEALSERKEEFKPAIKPTPERYFEAVGRRKTAIARVRLYTKAGDFLVNEKSHQIYFPTLELRSIAEDSLQKMKLFGRFRVSAKISGGGIHAQAEALRHGLARCLIKLNPDFRKRLKRVGFLKRDPRMKERKKFGLKKARKAPQWAKR